MAGEYSPNLRLVDVASEAREASAGLQVGYGDSPREHDWRFVIDTPAGGETTFNRYATAEYVNAMIEDFKTAARTRESETT